MTYEELEKALEERDLYIDDVYYGGRLADRNCFPRVIVEGYDDDNFAEALIKEYHETNDLTDDEMIEVLWWDNILTCEECGKHWYNDDYSTHGEFGEYGWYCPECLENESICEDLLEQKYIDEPKTALVGDLLDSYDLEDHGWTEGERSYSHGWYTYNDNIKPEAVFNKVKREYGGHVRVIFVVTDRGYNPFETNWTYYYKVDEDYLERLLDEMYPGTHSA